MIPSLLTKWSGWSQPRAGLLIKLPLPAAIFAKSLIHKSTTNIIFILFFSPLLLLLLLLYYNRSIRISSVLGTIIQNHEWIMQLLNECANAVVSTYSLSPGLNICLIINNKYSTKQIESERCDQSRLKSSAKYDHLLQYYQQ